jgi:hypothetical protein
MTPLEETLMDAVYIACELYCVTPYACKQCLAIDECQMGEDDDVDGVAIMAQRVLARAEIAENVPEWWPGGRHGR